MPPQLTPRQTTALLAVAKSIEAGNNRYLQLYLALRRQNMGPNKLQGLVLQKLVGHYEGVYFLTALGILTAKAARRAESADETPTE